jgi:hypothetical protein
VSELNNRCPQTRPSTRRARAFIEHLKSFDLDVTYARLADGAWAERIFWAQDGDDEYVAGPFPSSVRIPAHAVPAATRDSQLTIYDVPRGYVIKLHHATVDGSSWTAMGGSLYYLASNGLIGRLPESDEPRNRGHRGPGTPTGAPRLSVGRGANGRDRARVEGCDP